MVSCGCETYMSQYGGVRAYIEISTSSVPFPRDPFPVRCGCGAPHLGISRDARGLAENTPGKSSVRVNTHHF